MKAIDLISFLRKYYRISHSKITFDRVTHEDIAMLFSYIQTKKREKVTDEELARGDVIGVYDKTNRIVYYQNPRLNLDEFDMVAFEDEENQDELIIFSIDDLENLSKDELLHLRRKLRLNNQRKDSYMINALIKQIKNKEPRKYREKKEKILIKERENYYD